VTSFDLLSKYLLIMELRFDSNLAKKILMRTNIYVHAGCRFATPDLDNRFNEFSKTTPKVRQLY